MITSIKLHYKGETSICGKQFSFMGELCCLDDGTKRLQFLPY